MNTYPEVIEYLFRLRRMAPKLGLENIRALLKEVGYPHRRWPAIHIAGTNGKGSTAAMIESILLAAGYRVGLYTSPHLVDFRERIRVNRRKIPPEPVVEFTRRIAPLIEAIQPSFFEVTTALAFHHFADEQVDVAVVETGMGGRLDSTRVVHPLVTLITPISLDHQQYLGDTLEQIAAEKAGIIRKGVPCLTNNTDTRVLAVLRNACEQTMAPFINVMEESRVTVRSETLTSTTVDLEYRGRQFPHVQLALPGTYQVDNLRLAVAAVLHLPDRFEVTESAIRNGLASVHWKGRLELISQNPPVMIDVSHNPAGFRETLDFVRRFFSREQIHAVTFLQEDKDGAEIGRLLACSTRETMIVRLPHGKPADPEYLRKAITSHGGTARIVETLEAVYEEIMAGNDPARLWLIIGSHYLAGEAYQKLIPRIAKAIQST